MREEIARKNVYYSRKNKIELELESVELESKVRSPAKKIIYSIFSSSSCSRIPSEYEEKDNGSFQKIESVIKMQMMTLKKK